MTSTVQFRRLSIAGSLLVALSGLACASVWRTNTEPPPAAFAEAATLGAVHLPLYQPTDAAFQPGLRATIANLRRRGGRPSEWFVTAGFDSVAMQQHFHLYHESSLRPLDCHRCFRIGSPSGIDHTVVYDPRTRRIVRVEGWQ
jgi:hypothetical protein